MIGHFATAAQVANSPALRPCLLTATDACGASLSESFPADRFVSAYRRYLDVVNSDTFAYVRLVGPSGLVREYGDFDLSDE